jgi:hypothetical protein
VQAIGERITLTPDESGEFLWAEYGVETAPMLVALGVSEIMVAGAGFSNFRQRVNLDRGATMPWAAAA